MLQPVTVSGTRKVFTVDLVIGQRLYLIPHVRMAVSPSEPDDPQPSWTGYPLHTG